MKAGAGTGLPMGVPLSVEIDNGAGMPLGPPIPSVGRAAARAAMGAVVVWVLNDQPTRNDSRGCPLTAARAVMIALWAFHNRSTPNRVS